MPLVIGIIGTLAFAAWLVAAYGFVQAWLIAERHAPFRAIGAGRYLNWVGALSQMPAESKPYLSLAGKAFAAFFAVIILAIGASILAARP